MKYIEGFLEFIAATLLVIGTVSVAIFSLGIFLIVFTPLLPIIILIEIVQRNQENQNV